MNNYSKKQTISALNIELLSVDTLYKASCINWSGKTNDTNEIFTEVISEELMNSLAKLQSIVPISRTKSYCRENHFTIQIDISKSNRDEENFAKRITGMELDKLGLILDYQVPLKDTSNNKGVGKIDIVSYNKNHKHFNLIELKYLGNKETLLRAILECYTYFKTIDKAKLLSDYEIVKGHKFIINKMFDLSEIQKIEIIPAVLVVPGCTAYKELNEMEQGKRRMLKALSKELGIRFFTIDFPVNQYVP